MLMVRQMATLIHCNSIKVAKITASIVSQPETMQLHASSWEDQRQRLKTHVVEIILMDFNHCNHRKVAKSHASIVWRPDRMQLLASRLNLVHLIKRAVGAFV